MLLAEVRPAAVAQGLLRRRAGAVGWCEVSQGLVGSVASLRVLLNPSPR